MQKRFLSLIWAATISKMRSIAYKVHASGVSPSLAFSLFNQRGTPAVVYLAQFLFPPRTLPALETRVFSLLLGVNGTFAPREVAAISKSVIGGPLQAPLCHLMGHFGARFFQNLPHWCHARAGERASWSCRELCRCGSFPQWPLLVSFLAVSQHCL